MPASWASSEQGNRIGCGKAKCERPRLKMQMRGGRARISSVADVAKGLPPANPCANWKTGAHAIEVRAVGEDAASSEGVNDRAAKAKFADVDHDSIMCGEHVCAAWREEVDALMRALSAAWRTKGARDGSA